MARLVHLIRAQKGPSPCFLQCLQPSTVSGIQQALNYFLYCQNEEAEAQSSPRQDRHQNPHGPGMVRSRIGSPWKLATPVVTYSLWSCDGRPQGIVRQQRHRINGSALVDHSPTPLWWGVNPTSSPSSPTPQSDFLSRHTPFSISCLPSLPRSSLPTPPSLPPHGPAPHGPGRSARQEHAGCPMAWDSAFWSPGLGS